MGEEWDQLFHQNSITRVENDDADFNYSSSEDEADNNSSSCDAPPQRQNHIKGLSKFYQGKSQSFTSFSGITCVNDLAKKVISPAIKRKIKQSRSYAVGLDANDTHKPYSKPASSDKNLKGSCASSVARTNLLPPSIPMHKNM